MRITSVRKRLKARLRDAVPRHATPPRYATPRRNAAVTCVCVCAAACHNSATFLHLRQLPVPFNILPFVRSQRHPARTRLVCSSRRRKMLVSLSSSYFFAFKFYTCCFLRTLLLVFSTLEFFSVTYGVRLVFFFYKYRSRRRLVPNTRILQISV